MLEPDQSNNRLSKASQQHGAYESSRHRPREGKVVVSGGQFVMDVRGRGSVDKDIVGGLDVERLFDLGVGGDDEVNKNESGYQERKENIWVVISMCVKGWYQLSAVSGVKQRLTQKSRQ